MLSRREFWRLAAGLSGLAQVAGRTRAAAASRLKVDALLAASELDLRCPMVRNYRADAVVTLLGMPVFARKGVGAAFAAIGEAAKGDRRLIALRFAGGSHPDRTHGLLYDGSLEEVTVERDSSPARAAYFGFVTSSKDETYEQARKRVLSSQKGMSASYVAVEGLHIAGCARCEKGIVSVDDTRRLELAELNQRIREEFSDTERIAKQLATSSSSAAPTFLYAMLAALRSAEVRSQLNYVHSAREYRLECERTPDPRTGAAMAANGLTNQAGAVMRFTVRLSALATRQVSTFRLWLDNQSPLPLRIEYAARSYLRISLEYEPVEAQPNQKCKEET